MQNVSMFEKFKCDTYLCIAHHIRRDIFITEAVKKKRHLYIRKIINIKTSEKILICNLLLSLKIEELKSFWISWIDKYRLTILVRKIIHIRIYNCKRQFTSLSRNKFTFHFNAIHYQIRFWKMIIIVCDDITKIKQWRSTKCEIKYKLFHM